MPVKTVQHLHVRLDSLMTDKAVAEVLCIGVRTVWRWATTGRIPAPVRLGPKTTRWKASEIEAYLQRQEPAV